MGEEQKDTKATCCAFTDECIYSRRCFMTGEYCSKQNSIQRERNSLYKKEKPLNSLNSKPDKKNIYAIRAFVIMNFSEMSDVMYKWRLKTFIESLAPYFYVNEKEKKIYCKATLHEDTPEDCLGVNRIEVVRSDTDPASNYVICSRICQQMQIADLIVVDVSSQNTNVFYEFGMAVALGKMILPICYSESFYKKGILYQGKSYDEKQEHHIGCYPWRKTLFEYYGILYKNQENDELVDNYRALVAKNSPVEEQADRKKNAEKDKKRDDEKLRSEEKKRNDCDDEEDKCLGSVTRYLPFHEIKQEDAGFEEDAKYNRFPYDEYIETYIRVGERTYDLLRNTYNCAKSENNTLVVYTMDGFLNDKKAGQCIVNYHHYIVSRMKEEKCFRGDRVGVLVQENDILEEDKDSRKPQNLFYKVGEIIHIGVNQATYLALGEKIKTKEFLNVPACMDEESPFVNPGDYSMDDENKEEGSAGKVSGQVKDECSEKDTDGRKLIRPQQKKDIIISVKSYIRNRAMLMYPNYPIYVSRMKKEIQMDILKTYPYNSTDYRFFCLYYVMLRNLRYTNEIVVDISGTDTQALFWLGAAHGSDIYAITVKHEKSLEQKELQRTEREVQKVGIDPVKAWNIGQEEKERNIFDVSGLWTAILRSNDTEGFYRQLYLAQSGIERHSKLMLKDMEYYEKRMREFFSDSDETLWNENLNTLRRQKNEDTTRVLESYYRSKFWNRMLKYNRLNLYLPQIDVTDENDNQKRIHAVKWDVSSIASLSHYISKRTVIGEYRVETLKKGEPDDGAQYVNFICIGGGQMPMGTGLSEHIFSEIESREDSGCGGSRLGCNVIHKSDQIPFFCKNVMMGEDDKCMEEHTRENENLRYYKGFIPLDGSPMKLYTQHPSGYCAECIQRGDGCGSVRDSGENISNFCTSRVNSQDAVCRLGKGDTHIQLAQVVLWRDTYPDKHEHTFYRVEINGSSGPATFGLSTLFVDDEQKRETFSENLQWNEHNMLCELQETIRKKLMEIFIGELNRRFCQCDVTLSSVDKDKNPIKADEKQKQRYFSLVRHSITLYLSTVLYRYFMPFLSEEDVDCICNSTSSYIATLKAENISPFAHDYPYNGDPDFYVSISVDSVNDAICIVEETLSDVLNRFRGVEAFYEVKVKVDAEDNPTDQDTRKLVDIEKLNVGKSGRNELQQDICWVNCLFAKKVCSSFD